MERRVVSRGADLEVLRVIVELGREGLSSEKIADELVSRFPDHEHLPGPRAIRRRLQQALGPAATHSPADPSEEWTLEAAPPGEAALIAPAWGAAMRYLETPVGLSRQTAEWIARLRTIAPTMPPLVAWSLALEYLNGFPRASLDRYVALELWRDEDELWRLVEAKWVSPIPITAIRARVARRPSEDPVDVLIHRAAQAMAAIQLEFEGRPLPADIREAAGRLGRALQPWIQEGEDESEA